MSKATLVIISLKGCPACIDLKRNLPSIENELKGVIKVVKIEVSSFGEMIREPYPVSLNSLSGTFYPTLIMIPSADWEQAVINPSTFKFDRFQIMDAVMENGRPRFTNSKGSGPKQIVDWAIKTEPLLDSQSYKVSDIAKLPGNSTNDSYDNHMNYAVCGIKYIAAMRKH